MKTHLTTLMFLVSLLASCSSQGCTSQNTPSSVTVPSSVPSVTATVTPSSSAPVPETPVVTEQVVSMENWSFVLPEHWDTEKLSCEVDSCSVVLRNNDTNKMVIFSRESFSESLDAFSILSLRSLKGVDAEVLSVQNVELNGHPFVKINAVKNLITVHNWVTVVNGNSYTLACGGMGDNVALCDSIAASLML
jgi:hypothetical protein